MGGTVSPRRYGDNIAELIYAMGNSRADAAAQSGEIWGNTLANLGETLGGAIIQRSQKKEMAKRDAAWVSYVQSGEWRKDPESAYVMSQRIWGPDEGKKQFEGLTAVARLSTGEKPNPEQDRKDMGILIRSAQSMTPEGRAAVYPQLAALGKKVFPQAQIPGEYDDKFWQSTIAPLAGPLLGEKAPEPKGPVTVSPGSSLVDPTSGKVVYSAPAAEKGPVSVSPGGTLVNPGTGEVVYTAPPAAKEPREPKVVQVETTDANGKAITRFVTPTPGASYPKPSGQGKPATGQQRKALNFFNRAKEALENVESLEDKVAQYGLVDQGRLAAGGTIGNFLKNDEQQKYRQAQRAFTEARLRKESGATIKDSEYDNDTRTYFAVPGDSKATIAQKAIARKAVLAGIAFESGDALKEFYGDEAEGMLADLKKASAGPGGTGGPKQVKSKAEFDALPSGTEFIDPMGQRRRKP